MNVIQASALGTMLALMASPASADWQYTRWGMTPAQVVTASQGAVQIKTGTEGDRVFGADLGAAGTYSAAGFDFTTQFYFDAAERLKGVRLHTDFARCAELKDTMAGLYGPNGALDRMGGRWVDVENNNNVRLTMMAALPSVEAQCFLVYSPITTTGASGL